MKKFYHSYIKKFQFIPKSTLYNEELQSLISDFNQHEATLYFIVKTPIISFLPELFEIDNNYNLSGEISIGSNRTKTIKFNAVEMLYQMPELKEHFPSLESFCNTYMNLYDDLSIPNNQKYKQLASIRLNDSDHTKLRLQCPIVQAITQGKGSYYDFRIYQVLNYFNMDVLGDLQILYIGKSNDNTWKRLYNHNKWGFLEEHRDKSKEDFLVYFLQLDDSAINLSNDNNLTIIHRDNDNSISLEDATKITEATLINHFIKVKKFNKEMVNIDLSKWEFIKNKLANNKYSDVVVELYLDGVFGKLGTVDTGYNFYHKIEYEI